jgi:hypothetical protein
VPFGAEDDIAASTAVVAAMDARCENEEEWVPLESVAA